MCTIEVGMTCRNIPEGHLLQLQQNRPEDTIEMIQVPKCTYINTHTQTDTYVHIYIYIYTHTHTNMLPPSRSILDIHVIFIHTYLHICSMRNPTVGAG